MGRWQGLPCPPLPGPPCPRSPRHGARRGPRRGAAASRTAGRSAAVGAGTAAQRRAGDVPRRRRLGRGQKLQRPAVGVQRQSRPGLVVHAGRRAAEHAQRDLSGRGRLRRRAWRQRRHLPLREPGQSAVDAGPARARDVRAAQQQAGPLPGRERTRGRARRQRDAVGLRRRRGSALEPRAARPRGAAAAGADAASVRPAGIPRGSCHHRAIRLRRPRRRARRAPSHLAQWTRARSVRSSPQ